MDGFHIQGMAEDKRQSLLRTQVGEPVPRKDALHSDDNILPRGGNDLQKRLRARRHIAMHQDLAVVVENTDVQGAGVQVDAAIKWMLLSGEAPEILWRRTGHTPGAMVTLLETCWTKKARSHAYGNPEAHEAGDHRPAGPVAGLRTGCSPRAARLHPRSGATASGTPRARAP